MSPARDAKGTIAKGGIQMSSAFVGQIMLTGFNFAPRGFALCNGQLMAIAQNTALYSLIGTQYGGDGHTTFALPDLGGRVPLGQDASGSYQVGQSSGAETVTLNSAQIPMHTHQFAGTSAAATGRFPTQRLYGNDTSEALYGAASGPPAVLAGQTLGPAGGNTPHDNMQPYRVINFAIALAGVFPQRP